MTGTTAVKKALLHSRSAHGDSEQRLKEDERETGSIQNQNFLEFFYIFSSKTKRLKIKLATQRILSGKNEMYRIFSTFDTCSDLSDDLALFFT